jgi:rhomboid family GlyGly-CTERM serine protease
MRSETTNIYLNQQGSTSSLKNNRLELRGLIALLLLTNLGLLLGNTPASNLMFRQVAIAAGEWWRMLSWPFVHVSRYHLLLDATAFLLLYAGLQEVKPGRRVAYLLTTIFGSLLFPLLFSAEIAQLGLCGLSGPAHGLFAVRALELRGFGNGKRLGNLLLCGLVLKICWELSTGTSFLQQLHLGDVGHPIVTTHAGGVIGGVVCYLLHQRDKNHVPPAPQKEAYGKEI